MKCMRSIVRLLWLLLALVRRVATDLNYTKFINDPDGTKSSIRMVAGSEMNFFSTEFVDPFASLENCPEVGAKPISEPFGITERYEIPQLRNDRLYNLLPNYTYLTNDQLDNPNSGRVSFGAYTETVSTKSFINDGDLLPLPANRTQICHYAIRMTRPIPAQNTAAWSMFKQTVAYGFETVFHFRILHRSQECLVGGTTVSPWCQRAGADGFAFVVQNFGRKIVGTEVSGMGYAFPKSLAVEFDTYRDVTMNDQTGNHISVHAPLQAGFANTGDHLVGELAHSADIPKLNEGTHVVRISYSVTQFQWDSLGRDYDAWPDGEKLRSWAAGRPGVLTVELNGKKVIVVAIDLVKIVQPDPTTTARAKPPVPPDPAAYDEQGSAPGKAWVGFTSSTNYFQYQSVDILSWTFKEGPACPGDLDGDVLCRLGEGTTGRSVCTVDGSPNCQISIQNIGRLPLMISAKTSYDRPFQVTQCERGRLEWNGLHPYFLGCARKVQFTHELTELWINTVDGQRGIIINDGNILTKAPQPFKRRSVFQWCVKEHDYDPTLLYFGECNCLYCTRVLDLQDFYATYYTQRCNSRFGTECVCFEASEVTHDMSIYYNLKPLRHMRLHVCRGCSYPSHCTQMLKIAACQQSVDMYQIGNPLAPTILSNGNANLSRDDGRVPDGLVRGDACQCEPQVRPYIGDLDGKAGMCSSDAELDTGNFTTLEGCSNLCQNSAKCVYLTYWTATYECRIYSSCVWELCQNEYCSTSVTYIMVPLGNYQDLKGNVQYFSVFPKRTVQATPQDCFECLHLYDEKYCRALCGPPSAVPFVHWPAGQRCGTCMFAGLRMFEMTPSEVKVVKNCVYNAIRASQDPWVVCNQTAYEKSGAYSDDLFNGVSTHFLSECPGRDFDQVGVACVPNLKASTYFKSQILSRMSAINDTVWSGPLECLNGLCQLVPRASCYIRYGVWPFNQTTGFDDIKLKLNSTAVNMPQLPPSQNLYVQADLQQYVITPVLPYQMENTTIEGFVTVDPSWAVVDLARTSRINATSSWSEDYLPRFAVDGDYASYWSSQVGTPGNMRFWTTYTVDLGSPENAGSLTIHWKEQPADFSIQLSIDNSTWNQLARVLGNTDTVTTFNNFFRARWVRIVMTRALKVRGRGPSEGSPVYSIYELEINRDANLARLQTTQFANHFSWVPRLAADDDTETWWLSMPSTTSSILLLDLGSVVNVLQTRITWRYVPNTVFITFGTDPCANGLPAQPLSTYYAGSLISTTLISTPWTGRCLAIKIAEASDVFGEAMAGITEVEVYSNGQNVAPTRAVVNLTASVPSPASFITPLANALDGDPTTYWLVQPPQDGPAVGTVALVLDLQSPQWVMTVTVTWAVIGGFEYKAGWYLLQAGNDASNLGTVEVVQGDVALSHTFSVFSNVRYITLKVLQVFFTNPGQQLGIEDLSIFLVSPNWASSPDSVVTASSAYSDCPDCNPVLDGSSRPHGATKLNDDDVDTWWGAPYGITSAMRVFVQMTFTKATLIDLVGFRFKFPVFAMSIQCATSNAFVFTEVGTLNNNEAYTVPVPLGSRPACFALRFVMSAPNPTMVLAQQMVVAIREVEVYALGKNWALNAATTASDDSNAQVATDASETTRWTSSIPKAPVNLTVDLGTNYSFWGLRLLMPSAYVTRDFQVALSDDGIDFEIVETVTGNAQTDLSVLLRGNAQFIMIIFLQGATYFSLRTMQVFGSPNLALGASVWASSSWNHSSFEAVDGDPATFFISEPLATSCDIQLDLGEVIFVGGGIVITWRYPAQDFALLVSHDTVTWKQYYAITGSLANVSKITGYFQARYLMLSMTRPSALNGDGSYAIYALDVYFDGNLAHYKQVTTTSTINPSIFNISNTIDGNLSTIWMMSQVTNTTNITYDLLRGMALSGFDILWRWAPAAYSVSYMDADTLRWVLATRFTKSAQETDVGGQQSVRTGFAARKVQVTIEMPAVRAEGIIVALRDVRLWMPDRSVNYALTATATASDMSVKGNPPSAAIDGNDRGTYWMASEGVKSGWMIVFLNFTTTQSSPGGAGVDIGRIEVFWRWFPGHWTIELYYGQTWNVISEKYDDQGLFTALNLLYRAERIRVTAETISDGLGIREIKVFGQQSSPPPAVEQVSNVWTTSTTLAIDDDTNSFWMSPSGLAGYDMELHIDLEKLYDANDIQVWFGYRPQIVACYTSQDNVNFQERAFTSGGILGLLALQDTTKPFPIRYVKLKIIRGYMDPERVWGTSIRNIAVLQFRNMARGAFVAANTTWDFPATWTTDGSNLTSWTSRFGAKNAQLYIDFGSVQNVAGMSFTFRYLARRYQVDYSLDGNSFQTAIITPVNLNMSVVLPSSLQFQAQVVRLMLYEPTTTVLPADDPTNVGGMMPILSLVDISVFSHPGGGGVFGLQNIDGTQFNTITYGLRSPGLWLLSTENDLYTQGLSQTVYPEDVGSQVHMVIVQQRVAMSADGKSRTVEVALYRNGNPYGPPYRFTGPADRLALPNTTRLIFGVRSTAQLVVPAPDGVPGVRDNVFHGKTHSPYFTGLINSVNVISNALSAEEVRGLYKVAAGLGPERGCHCFDSCPVGSNRFFPGIPVPCSGQGACRLTGKCECAPGFSGDACEKHCSQLSNLGACCKVDDDCPSGSVCNQATMACYP